METLTLEQAADILKVSPRSLADRRYRFRLRLPARKVGRKVVFVQADVLNILEAGRERMPAIRI